MKLINCILLITNCLISIYSSAENQDSIVSKASLFVIPNASYQQETSVAPGVAFGYYLKSKSLSRISSVSGSATYTFKNQFILNITPKIYFDKEKWYLYSNFNLKKFPDYYFGIGNKPTNLKQAFTSQSISLLLQPQYIFSKHFFVGTTLSARFDKVVSTASEGKLDSIFQLYGNIGWKPYSQISLGFITAYDTRDNQFYPSQGIFAKSSFMASKFGWGSSFSLQEFTLDFRHYFPLIGNNTFAYQLYLAGVFSKTGTPFQLLPFLGGRDLMRGFRQGMYRDDLLFLMQTEYRIPVYKRLKAAVFASAGDVMDGSTKNIDKIKISYGAGLRYRLNDARVHLRLDFAKNNYGDKLQFYITATEAF